MWRQVAIPDRRQEVVDAWKPVRRGDVDQLELRQGGEADPVHAVELLVEKVAALGHVLLPALALGPFANAVLRRRALHDVEPVAARPYRTFRRQDLDDLA